MGNLVPFVGMVGVILAQVSTMVVVKAAMSKGTNKYVIAVYSNGLSSLFLLILCLFRFNRSDRPRLTLSILGRFFMLAFISVTCQMTGYIGINYSSPTLATAMLNLVPAFTFILAILFRMETVDWRSKSSQAKSLGAVVSIVGAFVVTFYKGPQITMAPTRTISTPLFSPSPQHNWILGGFFLVCYAFEVSTWYIYQNSVIKHFPAVMITVFFSNLFATVLSAAFSLIAVKDFGAWRVKLDIGLVAIMYSGVVFTALQAVLCVWCISKAGPFYCSMFKPLAIVFAAIMDVILLQYPLHLGSLIGASIIVCGFYGVMWGKSKEEKIEEVLSTQKLPFLQNQTGDVTPSV